MKHTELYQAYKNLDELERRELIAAVKAHGGEYIFIHMNEEEDEVKNEDEVENAPVILASRKYEDSYSDYRVSRVSVEVSDDVEFLHIFGWPTDPNWPDEDEIDFIAHGHVGYIIDCIPETDEVKDVTITSQN